MSLGTLDYETVKPHRRNWRPLVIAIIGVVTIAITWYFFNNFHSTPIGKWQKYNGVL